MSDYEMDYGLETQYHLWRRFNSPPYRRFALTVERSRAPEGYTITDYDPKVADSAYLSKFAGFMRSPMLDCYGGGTTAAGIKYTELSPVEQPGSEAHYEAAVRRFPDSARLPTGRES